MKRYDIFAYCGCDDNDINYEYNEHPTGDFCKWEDVAELKTKLAIKDDVNRAALIALDFAVLENTKFREALERVADTSADGNYSCADTLVSALREIAREALEEK